MEIINYKKTVNTITQDLTKLEVYAGRLKMDNTAIRLHNLNEHIREDRFNVAVLGEFSRGKSTLINALLQKKILPSYMMPTTASVNRITYDVVPRARVEYFDGSFEDIDFNDLEDYATQDGDHSENVREITLWYPTIYCANNVDLYDTPGLNDNPKMAEATLNVISRMDVAVFTLTADADFSISESEFLSEKLLTSDVGRVIFVLTHMGDHSAEDQARIIQNTRDRIQELVLAKAEKVLADRPEELTEFRKKLGTIEIYGVDSKMALKARENYDEELMHKSGFRKLELAIDDLLTRERGKVMLDRMTGNILKTARDIFTVIQAKIVPLTASEEEIDERYKKTESEINSIKELTQNEIQRLEAAKQEAIQKTDEVWKQYISEIREKIIHQAENLEITKDDLNEKNRDQFVQDSMNQKIIPMIRSDLQISTEKIQKFISELVGNEIVNLNTFEDNVSKHMEEITDQFRVDNQQMTISEHLVDIIKSSVFNVFSGGMRYGRRIAGTKGAIVGGLTGGAITTGSYVAIDLVLGAIAGATGTVIATPVVVAGAIVAATIGLFGSKKVVKSVFWKDRAEFLQKQIGDEAIRHFDDLLTEYNFNTKLHDEIINAFNILEKNLNENTMDSLIDTQKTLINIKENYAAEKAHAEMEIKDYTEILEDVSSITDRALSIRKANELDPKD